MPYAILVSALGAIVSTAIAMFVLHSWPAIKIAPAVGAILGLLWAVTMVKIRGLSLRCTLEEYRAIAGVRSLHEIGTFCSNTALKAALVVSIIEVPIVPFGKTAALLMLPAGWVFIIAWTVYRAWKINDQPSLNGGLDVFQISGGVALHVHRRNSEPATVAR